jgi:hypothetical protein
MEQKLTLSQYKATAKFHRRMEELYKQVGRLEDSESARKAAEALETEIKKMKSNNA